MSIQKNKTLATIALGAALCMTLAACSDTASGGDGTQGISDDKVITLGSTAPKTGALAGAGLSSIYGGKYAFDRINEAGGVNGYTVELEVRDDGSDPTRTVREVRSLWESDKVFGLFMPYGSGANQAAAQYVESEQIPLLFPWADASIFFEVGATPPENVFGFVPPYESVAAHLIEWAKEEHGIQTIAEFHTDELYGQAGADGVKETAESLGLDLVAEVSYGTSETDFKTIGRKIAASGADAAVNWALRGGPQVMQAANEAGFDGIWLVQTNMFTATAVKELAEMDAVEGRTYMSIFQRMEADGDEEIRDFYDGFREEYPDYDPALGAMGWTQALALEDAIKRATADGDDLTWDKLQAALNDTKDLNVGAGVDITYNPKDHYGITKARVYGWNGEVWEPASDGFTTLAGLG